MRHESALNRAAKDSRELPSAVDLAGTWRNELGSTMELTVHGNQVTGTYQSAVSGTNKPVTGVISGYVNGDMLSFVVNWEPIVSLTAWVGQIIGDTTSPAIETMWLLTTDIPNEDEPQQLWRSVLTGSDRFTQTQAGA